MPPIARIVAIHRLIGTRRGVPQSEDAVPAAHRAGFQYMVWKPYARNATVRPMKTHLYGASESSALTQTPAAPTLRSTNGNRQQAAHTPSDARIPPAAVHLTIRDVPLGAVLQPHDVPAQRAT